MILKKIIKKLLGERVIRFVKNALIMVKHARHLNIEGNAIKIISRKGYHVFFGYYDYRQFSADDTKLLIHIVKKNANPLTDDAIIAYYDIVEDRIVEITKTSAWCWQQGSRLCWLPNSNDEILYNDYLNNSYVCIKYNISTDEKTIYPIALYDFNWPKKFGLSINFSRLQRLRPGYGYLRIKDKTIDQEIPESDGIFKLDFETKSVKRLVAMSDIVEDNNNSYGSAHYINHISISPNGTRFSYFHLTVEGNGEWKTQLYVCTSDGTDNCLVENDFKVSHYTWKDDDNILVTCYKGTKQFYELINIKQNTKRIIESPYLVRDGHPTFVYNDFIITDTYPNKDSMQELFLCDIGMRESKHTIAKLFHYPFLDGEKRCDLHPRISNKKNLICIDTTSFAKRRSCALFRVDYMTGNKHG